MTLFGGVGDVRAHDASDDEADDSDDSDDSDPDEADETVVVIGDRARAEEEARRRPESAFAKPVDDSVPPTATVADVLQDVAGASVRRTGGPLSPAFVSVRGSSSQQVAVFVDGVPLNSFGAASVDLSQLPLRAFDRVEVYRGFAPPHLGGFAIGGAVDLVSDPLQEPAPRLEVGYGSFQTRRVVLSAGRRAPLRGGLAQVSAHVGYLGTHGDFPTFSNNGTFYDDTDDVIRRRANNHRDQLLGLFQVALLTPRFDLRILDAPLWSDGGVAGAYNTDTREARSRTVQNLVHTRATWRIAPAVTLLGGVGWRVRSELYEDLLGEVGVGTQDQRNHRNSIDTDLSFLLEPLPWLEVRPSVRNQLLFFRGVDLVGGKVQGPLRSRVGTQAAIDARLLPLGDRLEVRGAFGVLLVEDRAEGAESNLLVDVLPGIAVAASPAQGVTLRASVARSVRAPTFVELFGDRGSVVGNSDLRPERGSQVDGGVNLSFGRGDLRGAVELGGYVRDVTDLIALVPNSAKVGVPQNLGRVLLAGAETYGEIKARYVEGSVALTLNPGNRILDGENGTVGNRAPHVPLWQAHASLAFVLDPWVRVQWRFSGQGGTYDSPSNFFGQAARPLHDLFIRLQPHRKAPWIGFDLRNVFNTHIGDAYRNPLRPDPADTVRVNLQDFRGQPLPGRSFMLTVGWTPGASS
ncbi:MAG: TonB-dependent receptor [Deltaproteobacteria bacterium]|nr:TonB-dependent receptor [Deltaproteobacteria bacterium]